MKRNTILTAAGVALLVFVAGRIGWGAVAQQIQAVWMALPVILGLSFLRLWMQTGSWGAALRAEGIAISTGELMGMRLASQGMGYLTPLGPAISEPMKVRLAGAGSTAPTLVDTGAYWFTSAFFGVFACVSAGLLIAHGHRATVVLTSLAAAFVVGLILMTRPKPLLSPLAEVLGERCPRWLKNAHRGESAIRGFAVQHRGVMRKMLWLDFGCQLLLAAEVVAVFWILRIPFHAGTVLALEAANRGVKMLTGWMPGRIGADEGGTAGAFAALGLSSASGLALALTRRARDLMACAVGLVWLAWKFRNTQIKEAALCRP